MYPTLYDFLSEFFGSIESLSFLKAINSFGFFIALSIITCYWLLRRELIRKKNEGLLESRINHILKGEKLKVSDLVINGIIGFLFGYKLIGILLELVFSNQNINSQDYLISTEGSYTAGVIVALIMTYSKYREAKKQELDKPIKIQEEIHPYQLVGNITIIAIIFGFIGTKVFHILENLDSFYNHPTSLLDPFSGLTYYGGLIFGGLAVVIYAKKNKIHILHLLDASGPILIAAYGIGRIGCHISGDGDWGIANPNPKPNWLSWAPDWLWAYNYPNNVLHVNPATNLMDSLAIQGGLPIERGFVFPTPLYETILMALIFILLWNIRKRIKIAGLMFAFYLSLNGLERFFIEKIRVNENLFGTSITQAEIISSIMILAGIILFIWTYNKHTNNLTYGS